MLGKEIGQAPRERREHTELTSSRQVGTVGQYQLDVLRQLLPWDYPFEGRQGVVVSCDHHEFDATEGLACQAVDKASRMGMCFVRSQ